MLQNVRHMMINIRHPIVNHQGHMQGHGETDAAGGDGCMQQPGNDERAIIFDDEQCGNGATRCMRRKEGAIP